MDLLLEKLRPTTPTTTVMLVLDQMRMMDFSLVMFNKESSTRPSATHDMVADLINFTNEDLFNLIEYK